jgi:hypothetical protein
MRFRSTLKKDKHDKADKVKSATNAIQEEEDETRSDCVVM